MSETLSKYAEQPRNNKLSYTVAFCWSFSYITSIPGHAAGGAVVWGTALQAGRSRVPFLVLSLDFSIDNPSARTMTLGVDSASNRNEYQEYFLGVTAAGA
jgi:hypothetical protein